MSASVSTLPSADDLTCKSCRRSLRMLASQSDLAPLAHAENVCVPLPANRQASQATAISFVLLAFRALHTSSFSLQDMKSDQQTR